MFKPTLPTGSKQTNMILPTSSAHPRGSLDFISTSLFFQKLLGPIKIGIVYHP